LGFVLKPKGRHKSQGSGELAPVQRRQSLPIPVKIQKLHVILNSFQDLDTGSESGMTTPKEAEQQRRNLPIPVKVL
jgi:hypothetical protein